LQLARPCDIHKWVRVRLFTGLPGLACEFLSLHFGRRLGSCQNHDARGEPSAGGGTRNHQKRGLRRSLLQRSAKKIQRPSRRLGDISNRLCLSPIQAMNGRHVKQVMLLGQYADQGITPVTPPRVYGQTRGLVDHHDVIAFMDDRNRGRGHGRLVPVHVVRDDVPVAAKNGCVSVPRPGSRPLTVHVVRYDALIRRQECQTAYSSRVNRSEALGVLGVVDRR
jgi:hypothetical protein